jgi:hypothetical protein
MTIMGCGGRAGEQTFDPQGEAGTSAGKCEPGQTRECTGPGACRGGQQCSDKGRWGTCECAAASATGGNNGQGGTTWTSAGGTTSQGGTTGSGARSSGRGGTTAATIGGTSTGGTSSSTKGGTTSTVSGGTNAGGTTVWPKGGAGASGTYTAGKPSGGASVAGSSWAGASWAGAFTGGTTTAGATSKATGGTSTGGTTTAPNHPPVILEMTLSDYAPRTDDLLTVSVKASDPDSDPITYKYAWTSNGIAVGYSSSQLDGRSYFSKGDEIHVTVTPSDGKDSGTPVTSGSAIVQNSPPTVWGIPWLEPYDTVDDGKPLVCDVSSVGYDPDSDPLTYTYHWQRNGSDTTQTDKALLASVTQPGESWTCRATVSDGTVTAETGTSSPTLVVTEVSGILRANTTWAAAKSPYLLTNRVQIDKSITLTVEPGVRVIANDYYIESWGSVSMIGTKDKPIQVERLWMVDNSTTALPGKIELVYVQYDGGGLMSSTIGASTHLADCVIQNTMQTMYLAECATCTHLFERNVFRNTCGIQSYAPLTLTNNVFDSGYTYCVEVSAQETLTAKDNSFYGTTTTSNFAIMLGPKDADARNNYWGGLTDTEVPDRIYDNNDDLNIAGKVDYLPTLTSAHASTPPRDTVYVTPK